MSEEDILATDTSVVVLYVLCLVCLGVFYAPNFEEVEGAYWLWSVRPVVCSQSVMHE